MEKFFVDRKFWGFRHGLFWLVIYADAIFPLFYEYEGVSEIYDLLIMVTLDMILVYTNIYILIPKFLVKKKYAYYILGTIFSVLLVVICNYVSVYISWTAEELEDLDWIGSLLQSAFYTAGTLGIAAAIKITKYFYERQNHLNELKQSQLTSEVNYLKQQTNPHFLFNTLNSIYVLAKQKRENTPAAIMLLSDLMRYQTYDASSEKVPLTKEVEFIRNYLELEKLRRDKLHVNINIEGNIKGELIEPLLFLPFIENAVKHSASTDEQVETIDILLQDLGERLILNVKNSIGENALNSMQKENSGFGLKNAYKRLNLLYPESHTLNVIESSDTYQLQFTINK